MSVRCAHPTGEVSSLNCVYLLPPCRENLPINWALILSVNDLLIRLLYYTASTTNLRTSPPHSSLSHPPSPPVFLCCSLLSCVPPCIRTPVRTCRINVQKILVIPNQWLKLFGRDPGISTMYCHTYNFILLVKEWVSLWGINVESHIS